MNINFVTNQNYLLDLTNTSLESSEHKTSEKTITTVASNNLKALDNKAETTNFKVSQDLSSQIFDNKAKIDKTYEEFGLKNIKNFYEDFKFKNNDTLILKITNLLFKIADKADEYKDYYSGLVLNFLKNQDDGEQVKILVDCLDDLLQHIKLRKNSDVFRSYVGFLTEIKAGENEKIELIKILDPLVDKYNLEDSFIELLLLSIAFSNLGEEDLNIRPWEDARSIIQNGINFLNNIANLQNDSDPSEQIGLIFADLIDLPDDQARQSFISDQITSN